MLLSFLYKYVVPERVDVLRNQLIRFTQPSELNDPFDLRLVLNEPACIPPRLRISPPKIPVRYLAAELSFKAALIQQLAGNLTLETPWKHRKQKRKEVRANYIPEIAELQLALLDSTTGVLSLTEEPRNMAMWAHYAGQGKGFLIEFNRNNAFFHQGIGQKDFREVRPVTYIDRRSTEPGPDEMAFLFRKTMEWSYEREWRMILPLDECSAIIPPCIHLFQFPASCISGIVFGAAMDDEFRSEITQIVNEKYPGATFHEIVLNAPFGPELRPINAQKLKHYTTRKVAPTKRFVG